jgi:hypothetical protein
MLRESQKSIANLLTSPRDVAYFRILLVEGKAEINHHGLTQVTIAHDDVARLEVSVANVFLMTNGQDVAKCPCKHDSLRNGKRTGVTYPFVEGGSVNALQYHEHGGVAVFPCLCVVI